MSLSNQSKGIKEITIDGKTVASITRNSDNTLLYEKENQEIGFFDSLTSKNDNDWIFSGSAPNSAIFSDKGVNRRFACLSLQRTFQIPCTIEFDITDVEFNENYNIEELLIRVFYPNLIDESNRYIYESAFRVRYVESSNTFSLGYRYNGKSNENHTNVLFGSNYNYGNINSPIGHYKMIVENGIVTNYKDGNFVYEYPIGQSTNECSIYIPSTLGAMELTFKNVNIQEGVVQ